MGCKIRAFFRFERAKLELLPSSLDCWPLFFFLEPELTFVPSRTDSNRNRENNAPRRTATRNSRAKSTTMPTTTVSRSTPTTNAEPAARAQTASGHCSFPQRPRSWSLSPSDPIEKRIRAKGHGIEGLTWSARTKKQKSSSKRQSRQSANLFRSELLAFCLDPGTRDRLARSWKGVLKRGRRRKRVRARKGKKRKTFSASQFNSPPPLDRRRKPTAALSFPPATCTACFPSKTMAFSFYLGPKTPKGAWASLHGRGTRREARDLSPRMRVLSPKLPLCAT